MKQPLSHYRTGAAGGFTLVELSVVLVVIGCLTWAVSSAYGSMIAMGDRNRATQTGEVLKDAVRSFALRNGRLPCPDTKGNGWEGLVGDSCPAEVQAGWFPYYSLQLDLPAPALHALYAVYRNVSAPGNADLVLSMERTGDLPGTPGYNDTRDFMAALQYAATATQTPTSNHAYLTGDDGTEGIVNCADNVRSNPAYFVVLPLTDRGATGVRFDPPNVLGSLCAFSPGTAIKNTRDDVVAADSLASLTGWLGARAP